MRMSAAQPSEVTWPSRNILLPYDASCHYPSALCSLEMPSGLRDPSLLFLAFVVLWAISFSFYFII